MHVYSCTVTVECYPVMLLFQHVCFVLFHLSKIPKCKLLLDVLKTVPKTNMNNERLDRQPYKMADSKHESLIVFHKKTSEYTHSDGEPLDPVLLTVLDDVFQSVVIM